MTAQNLAYIELDQVKRQIGVPITDTYHDDRLNMEINAASGMVKNYLGSKSVYQAARGDDDDVTLDSNFEPVLESTTGESIEYVRPEVKKAVILIIQNWWGWNHAMDELARMPMAAVALLYPLRDPQLK